MIEVKVSKVSAPCPAKIYTEGRTYDVVTEEFDSLEDAMDWLDRIIPVDLDGGQPMYRDTENGHEQVGKIYSFWQSRYRKPGSFWSQRWVEIRELDRETVNPSSWLKSEQEQAAS